MRTRGATVLRVRLLGDIQVAGSGTRPLVGPQQRRAFALLAVRRNETTSVGQLVDVCWPDGVVPDRAEHNVRTYVHRLRTALGEHGDRIETSTGGYRFVLADDETDIGLFERLAAEALRLAEVHDHDAALDRIDEADALWRGRPYGELADEPWVEAQVARLTERRYELHEARAETLLEAGRAALAVGIAEQLVRDQPYRERPRALLMRSLYESGRQAEALRAFQDCRRFLIEEAGVEPSPDLVELDRRIATNQLDQVVGHARSVGDYELQQVIGEGAFAMVWRGTQPALGREVAVKQIRQQLANDPDFIRRFEIEARIVSALEHPFVVPLYDYWREPGAAFLVMRMLTGGTLETRLQDGPLEDAELRRLVEQVGSALELAHRQGVIHRDVKPGNILLDDEGNFFLTDFGIAFGIGDESDDAAAAALSTGSPAYAAPEQLRREALDARTDIYAFGIILFEAATGEVPFGDERTRAGLVQRQLEDAVPVPSRVRPGVAAWVDRVVTGATDKRRDDRYRDMRALIDDAIDTSAAGTRDQRTITGATVIPGELRNPFKGLRAFTEADAGDFRGRHRLVARFLEALSRPGSQGRLVAAVGPSGSGKSSAVRAGLIPQLRSGAIEGSATWFFTTMLPGAHPFEELESALVRVAAAPPGPLAELMSATDRGVARAVKQVVPGEDDELVLVIDQFEELFTLVDDEHERRAFIDGLIAAIKEPRSRLRVVVTIRADFWDRPLRYPNLAALLETAAVTISPLSADELERAIVDPVAEQGMAYEPGLVARISAEVVDQPGALPLLQYTLTQLFDREVSGLLTSAAYDEIGGVAGSVAQRAEEIHQGLTLDHRAAARRAFGRLVSLGEGVEDTRRRVALTEIGTDAATRHVVDEYGGARLLTFDRDPATRAPTVEVAHEALIREWPRLRGWLDDDRDVLRTHRHLTVASAAWAERDRDTGELYRGARLAGAESLVGSDVVTLTPTEAEFLATSLGRRDAETEAERRRVRRLRRLVTATGIVAIVALVAGGTALWQWNRADDQTARAQANAREAADNAAEAEANAQRADANAADAETSAALAEQRATEAEAAGRQADIERMRAVALNLAPSDPSTAALVGVEAYRLDPSVESLDVLQRVLTEIPGYDGAAAGGPYGDAVLLDDTTLVAAGETSLDVWDLETRTITRSIPHASPGGATDVALVGDDRIAALDDDRSSTTVYDLAWGEVTSTIDHAGIVNDIDVSPDGSLIAAAMTDGTAGIWTVDDGRAIARFEAGALGPIDPAFPPPASPDSSNTDSIDETTDVVFVRWHPGGDRLAVVTALAGVQLWDVTTEQPVWANPDVEFDLINQVTPFAASFSPSGERFAYIAGSLDGVLVTLDTSDGNPAFDRIETSGQLFLRSFPVDDLVWTGEDMVTIPTRLDIVTVDLATGSSTTVVDQFVAIGNTVRRSPAIDRWVVAGLTGLEFWATDGSGPLATTIALPADQQASLLRGGGPVLTSLADDGSRLLTSVFEIPVPPPVYATDLTVEPVTNAVVPDLNITIGYGEFTLAISNFQVIMLDVELQPLGSPVPLPGDFTDGGVSQDGRYFAFGRLGGLADLYRSSGEFVGTVELGTADEFAGTLASPDFTTDGEYMSVVTTDARGGVWRTDTLERVDLPAEYRGWARALGPWLWVQGGEQRLDPETLEPVGERISNYGRNGLGYPRYDHAHDRLAVTGSPGVAVIDLETGLQIGRDLPYAGGSTRVEFTADGSYLSVPTVEGTVVLWNFDTDAWADIACTYAGRNLTADEWAQLGPRTIDHRETCDQYPTDE